jgi:hypothetical protein
MDNITMQNYSVRFPIVMLEHSERERWPGMGNITMQNYSARFPIVTLEHSEREMARNGQHYDAKLLCTVSNSDVGTFEERDGQEWATL